MDHKTRLKSHLNLWESGNQHSHEETKHDSNTNTDEKLDVLNWFLSHCAEKNHKKKENEHNILEK